MPLIAARVFRPGTVTVASTCKLPVRVGDREPGIAVSFATSA